MELYETFYMNTLETFILRGKRISLAETLKAIHIVVDQGLLTRMEEIKVVMKVSRTEQATLLELRGASNKTLSLFVLFVEVCSNSFCPPSTFSP